MRDRKIFPPRIRWAILKNQQKRRARIFWKKQKPELKKLRIRLRDLRTNWLKNTKNGRETSAEDHPDLKRKFRINTRMPLRMRKNDWKDYENELKNYAQNLQINLILLKNPESMKKSRIWKMPRIKSRKI